MSALLTVEDLSVAFPIRSPILRRTTGWIEAVAGVSFSIEAGRTLGLVGESGSGKSTIARTLMGLEPARGGRVSFLGERLDTLRPSGWRQMRRQVQMIFQDPYGSLNPRKTVFHLVSEPWLIHRDAAPAGNWRPAVLALLERVGLRPEHADRYPHEFSGGQRQRIGIARALALRPRLVICDEPVAALDVSVQAQVVNLLRDLQDEYGLSYLFIAHDLSVVRQMCDDVAVLYLGRIAEQGPAGGLFDTPRHPYTAALLSAVPPLHPWRESGERSVLGGETASPARRPSGCAFHPRCPRAEPVCARTPPEFTGEGGHVQACHFPLGVPAGAA